jgi:hypothetical protein
MILKENEMSIGYPASVAVAGKERGGWKGTEIILKLREVWYTHTGQ